MSTNPCCCERIWIAASEHVLYELNNVGVMDIEGSGGFQHLWIRVVPVRVATFVKEACDRGSPTHHHEIVIIDVPRPDIEASAEVFILVAEPDSTDQWPYYGP